MDVDSPTRRSDALPAATQLTDRLGGLVRYSVLVAVAALAPVPALAQDGAITGQVRHARTGAPLDAVQVYLEGSDVGGLTRDDGRYRLTDVAPGEHTLRAERIGFRTVTREVTVDPGASTVVDLQLQEAALSLDQIVVTGTAGGSQARAIGNPVSQVSVEEVSEVAPSQNIQELLSSRVPGLRVFTPPGNVGTGGPQKIRGASSMTLSSAPLVYVDGIRVDNDQFAGPTRFRNGRANRLNDFNPQEIRNVEVIKGPAAATLFGTEASSGVMMIETKRGRRGSPRFELSVQQGATWLDDPVDAFPAAYGTDPETGDIIRYHPLEADIERGRGSPFRTGHNHSYALGIGGGGDLFRYRFSSRFQRDEGAVPWNWKNKFNVRGNLSFTPSDEWEVRPSLAFVRSETRFAGMGPDLPTQLVWADVGLRDTRTRGYLSAPPGAVGTVEAHENLDRFLGSLTVRNRPLGWLDHRLRVGGDVVNGVNSHVFPRHAEGSGHFFGSNSLGRKALEDARTTFFTLDYSASASADVTSAVGSESSFGVQFYSKEVHTSGATGVEFPVPGTSTVSATATQTGSEDLIQNRTFGVYLQERLDWKDRAFLTVAVRGDDNSAFGENFDFVVYPKVSGTWVIHEEPFWEVPFVNALKLRAAWGEAGRQPDVFAARRLYRPRAGHGGRPGLTPDAFGNPDLKPEVGEEVELGFDAAFLDDRVQFDFTYYDQTTHDAIVERTVAPSEGFPGVQFVNIGEISNRGVELLLDARPVETDVLSWDLSLNVSTNHSEVGSLGGLPPLSLPPIQGVATGQKHVEGYPVAGIWDYRVVSAEFDDRGNVVDAHCADESGGTVPCSEAEEVFWGPALPTWEGGASTTLRLDRAISLHGLVDFMGGHKKISGDLWGAHVVFRNSRAIHEREDPILAAYDEVLNVGSPTGILDGSFAKLREVSLRYELPDSWTGGLGASEGSFTAALYNPATLWQEQSGTFGRDDVDAEAANADHGEFGGYYQTRFPPFSTFTASIRLVF